MESKYLKVAAALIEGEGNYIANLANLSALIYQLMENINWVGFYLYDKQKDQLVLGPFQGKPACLRIDMHKGVCGTAFADQKIIKVGNVHQFEGHIACDPESQSELVLPFKLSNGIQGVLDIDAPIIDRFTIDDQEAMRQIIELLEAHPHESL